MRNKVAAFYSVLCKHWLSVECRSSPLAIHQCSRICMPNLGEHHPLLQTLQCQLGLYTACLMSQYASADQAKLTLAVLVVCS